MKSMIRSRDIVKPSVNFQSSVNIDFDFGAMAKVESLIPTDSVCLCLEELLRDVISPSTERAKLLVGAYGKGKSHVVLAALDAMWFKIPGPFQGVIEAYRERGSGFADTLERFLTEGSRLLPVRITGSTADLRHSFLFALRNALVSVGFEDLMPETNYDGAIRVMERWGRHYPETLKRFEEITGESAAVIMSQLRVMSTRAYETFVDAYPELTSGGSFDVLEGVDVLSVYRHVLAGLKSRDVQGIYVVYDEFGKYLETNLERSTFEDIRLLQDFAEACARSGSDEQLHLLLISHKSLSNYIDTNIPKEKADGWRGVSGRFRELELLDDPRQYYELLEKAITKDSQAWMEWLDADDRSGGRMLERIGARYVRQGLIEEGDEPIVVFGCYPLHPVTTFLLAEISEKIAQNERTLFTFVCSRDPNALESIIDVVDGLVSPDRVYDYFEPILRKEFYASPFHRIYELVRMAKTKFPPASLDERIVKTIALIDIVSLYDRIAPTTDVLVDVFADCGFDSGEVRCAINRLIHEESVIYLRKSNAHLRLKESSGVRIDDEVTNRANALCERVSCVDILNRLLRETALYPSRYNEQRGMVRYFDCGFVDAAKLDEWVRGDKLIESRGDGQVVGVHLSSADELSELKGFAKDPVSTEPMTMIVFPRRYFDVDQTLYRLEAAEQLKSECDDDPVLMEEYELIIEDLSEVIDDYIAGFFQPELRRSLYFVGGHQRKSITRRRRLSEELSSLCEETFPNTPRITSEALNKNDLTGTAFGSRSKILSALCRTVLEPNFGFSGNGQETSMARSAFKMTGILPDFEHSTDEEGVPDEGMALVLDIIRQFIERANMTPFSVLYEQLKGRERGIGLREGPIPLYLAYELRKSREEIRITHRGQERPFEAAVLDDLSKDPSSYELTHVNWTPEMARYVGRLGELFHCPSGEVGKGDVVSAMRQWYVNLPQVTRISRYNHARGDGNEPLSRQRIDFFRTIRNTESDSDAVLFGQLPKAFGAALDSDDLVQAIAVEKESCDGFIDGSVDVLIKRLKAIFDLESHADATLGSVLRDWLEAHPALDTHSFSGMTKRVVDVARGDVVSDRTVVERLAKAATSLRIEDWNDDRFGDFLATIESVVSEVEGYAGKDRGATDGDTLGIIFVDEQGNAHRKTFDRISLSGRSRLLRSSIETCLDEMGGALSPEEKRQVVFEVLEELC